MLFHLLTMLLSTDHQFFTVVYFTLLILVGIALPFWLGRLIARQSRMQDYAWKIGLILMTVILAAEVMGRTWDPERQRFEIKLGVDLKGGVILIYEVEEGVPVQRDPNAPPSPADDETEVDEDTRFSMDALVAALSLRINPAGTKEIVIRKYGDRQVEIIIPEVDEREVAQIKKAISTAGVLQFRIVANRRDHLDIIELAENMARDPIRKRSRTVLDETRSPVGLWARVARETESSGGVYPFKVDVSGFTLRDASSGDLLEVPPNAVSGSDDDARRRRLAEWVQDQEIREIDVLMATDDGYNVNGGHLKSVRSGYDEVMNPCIFFDLRAGTGSLLFSQLTADNSPEGNFTRQLGIVLDNDLLSAPNIQERITGSGRITGQFTQDEVNFLVNILQAGSLPAVLNKIPISENQISPLLGEATIRQGRTAIAISLVVVLVFILIYYRFAGMVACMALVTNLLFVLAMMVMIKAALTLPGLAGLVLTVGMSVDANVLIFERIREELKRGAALRMAIRNGFARATTTIVDANVTTLITALVLYAIGTDQIRGFAVTLILGILMSMYTAIFCSRVIFDLAERTRRLSKLTMMQIISGTQIDFIGMRRIAGAVSLLVIAAGVVAIVARGADIFDIDFRGGTSVHLKLSAPAQTEAVRSVLAKKFDALEVNYTLTGMSKTQGGTTDTFKVDSAIPEVEELEAAIQEAFEEGGDGLQLATYSLTRGEIRTTQIETPAAEPETEADEKAPAAKPAEKPAETEEKAPAASPAEEPAKTEEKAPSAETEEKPEATQEKPSASKPEEDSATSAKQPPAAKPETEPAAGEETVPAAKTEKAPAKPDAAESETPEKDVPEKPAEKPDGAHTPTLGGELLAMASSNSWLVAQAASETEPPAEKAAPQPGADEKQPAGDEKASPEPEVATDEEFSELSETAEEPGAAAAAEEGEEETAQAATTTVLEIPLDFEYGINYDTLYAEVDDARQALNLPPLPYYDLENPDWQGGSNLFKQWTLRIAADEATGTSIVDHLSKTFAETPVWPSSSKIGGQVAGRMQQKATMALLTSLLGIVVYIWIRFQRVVFGLAAVVALIHDVLVTLGAIAISAWLAGSLSFLLIEEFKISLPIVAALLTIIGYSLNDTIVVFDRIREVRGKSPQITAEMINKSINQTLSRTLLTSLTTLIVVAILYAIGGDGIHGFAFSLVVGVLVGTYSSIFVASPVLLWMAGGDNGREGKPAA
jgi:SecD/SecF fusion protein